MTRSAMLVVVALAAPSAFALGWTDLWVSPEQRAQHLLDSGHPAEAAALFADARRQAYARVEAGQYAQAAQELAPYHDANSQYNRGNALARMGNLPAALAAYDAALKRAPKDADVIHNRALVADALRQRQHNQTSTGSGSRPSSDRSADGGSPAHSAGTSPSSGAAGKNAQTASASSPPAARGQSAHRSPAEDSKASHQTGENSPVQAARKNDGISGAPLAATPKAADTSRENLQGQGSAARLSERVARQSASENNPHFVRSQDIPPGLRATPAPKPAPASEQSIAMDQWLRGIPDDSAELLRRKFLIEHMMKQQSEAQ